MGYQQLPGLGLLHPNPALLCGVTPAFGTSVVIDATGEKAAYVGRVWFPARTGTKAVRRVGFRFGAVTKAGGSALTISLQDVSTSSGPPANPDGTQDQTVAVANGDAAFASNTWYRSGTLSADRTVTYGDLLAVVVEFDGSGRLGSDSVALAYLFTSGDTSNYSVHGAQVLLNTGSWALQTGVPNVVLEFDDGSFGTLDGSAPMSALNTHTYSSSSNPDEYALEFVVTAPVKIDAIWAVVGPGSASANLDLVLYSGTTALQTVSVDGNTAGASNNRQLLVPIPETELSTGTTYRIAVKPTTTNNVNAFSFDVDDANQLVCNGGTGMTYTTRVDAGSWAAATATRCLFAGYRVSSIHDGTGGGGGMLVHPGTGGRLI